MQDDGEEKASGTSWSKAEIVRELNQADLELLTAARERAQTSVPGRITLAISVIGDNMTTFLVKTSQARAKKVKIYRPPGLTLDQFAQALFSRKTYQNTFKPTIDDHRFEHAEALAAGDLKLAKRIAIRCNAYMVVSMLAKIPFMFISFCFRLAGI